MYFALRDKACRLLEMLYGLHPFKMLCQDAVDCALNILIFP